MSWEKTVRKNKTQCRRTPLMSNRAALRGSNISSWLRCSCTYLLCFPFLKNKELCQGGWRESCCCCCSRSRMFGVVKIDQHRSSVFASMPQIKDFSRTKKKKKQRKNNCCMNGHLRQGGTDNHRLLSFSLLFK